MPGKRKPKGDPKPTVQHGIYYCDAEAAWGGFINVRLDDEQKEEFGVWYAENAANVGSFVEDILGEEAKVTLVYDRENECFVASVTGAIVGGSNERYVATSRAGTMIEVMGLLVWKHFFLADGDYGNYRTNGTMMKWG
jgi:hypothetical protein